jgi:Legionella pneumophila major outer membrane protein precursor
MGAPGHPNSQSFRPAQRAPARLAQMPAEHMMPPNGQPGAMYDGDPARQMAPLPTDGYRDGSYPSPAYGGPSCGCGNGGCNGSCGCGDGCSGGYGGGVYGDCTGDCSGACGGCDYGDCGGCGDACCDVMCGMYCTQPRLSVYVDWLSLQVSDADMAHAQQQDGIGGAGTVPFGRIGTVETDYDSGVRIGGSIGCGPCVGAVWSFTNFESYNEDRVNPPFIPGGGGAVGSLVHHPGAQITASVGPVDACYDIDFRMADLMCRHYVSGGPCHAVNLLYGVQYGHLEQFFLQEGIFSGGQSGTIDTFTNIDFDGGGVKAGFDAERQMCWGFLAYCKATAAIMTGRFSSRYDMVNTTTEVLLARARWKDDRVVPQLEYELGLGWTSPSGCWRFTTGYMLSHWANVVTTPEFVDAVQANNYVDVDGNLTFDGGVSRIEFRW